MLSWVFRNRAHLARVYAVAAEDAPLECVPIRPLQSPGQVLRLEDDVLLVPAVAPYPRAWKSLQGPKSGPKSGPDPKP